MSWQSVGERTFVPGDRVVIVGDFSLAPDHDTVWVRITSLSPPTPWPWSYGILGWRSSDGYELGSVKAYSEQLGEVFRLGVGLSPLQRDGQFTFEPRAYNLAWIQQGNPCFLVLALAPLLGCLLTLSVLVSLTNSSKVSPTSHFPTNYGRRPINSYKP